MKLVITIILIIGCGLAMHLIMCVALLIPLLIGFILLPNKKIFGTRFILFLPFVLATAAFQLFAPGRIVFHQITYEGLHCASLLGSKVALGIGYSLIFTLSTPKEDIARSLDWITMNKLELGKTLLISLKFIELIKNSPKKSPISALKYAIEELQSTNSTN